MNTVNAILNNRRISSTNLYLAVLIFPIIVLIALVGDIDTHPLAGDTFQYLSTYDSHMRREGRWVNFLLYPFLKNLTPSFALILDWISYAALGISIILPLLDKQKKSTNGLILAGLIFFWLSIPVLSYGMRWPGNYAFSNLAAIFAILFLQNVKTHFARLIIFSMAGILLVGQYQSHYFMIIIGCIGPFLNPKAEQPEIKETLLIILTWIAGFIVGYLAVQVAYKLLYDVYFHTPTSGYRVLDKTDKNFLHKTFTNLFVLLDAFWYHAFRPTMYAPVLKTVIGIGFLITIIGFLVSVVRNLSLKTLLIIALPFIGIISALAVTNHILLQRTGTPLWASLFFVIAYMTLQRSFLRIPVAFVALLFAAGHFNFSSQLARTAKFNAQKSTTTLSILLDSRVMSPEAHIILFGRSEQANFGALNHTNLYSFVSKNLGIKGIIPCQNFDQPWLCSRLKDTDLNLTREALCKKSPQVVDTNPEYILITLGSQVPFCTEEIASVTE